MFLSVPSGSFECEFWYLISGHFDELVMSALNSQLGQIGVAAKTQFQRPDSCLVSVSILFFALPS